MTEGESVDNDTEKLGPSFHRTFALIRPALAQVLEVAASQPQDGPSGRRNLSFDRIREGTTLGPLYVSSMRRYAYGAGLLDRKECLTAFGSAIVRHDHLLTNIGTIWLLHYHLCASHHSGPIFWHELITKHMRLGDEISTAELGEIIQHIVCESNPDKINTKTAQQAASVFLGSYSKPDSLGPLGIIRQLEPGRYVVTESQPPPIWVFGYALADFWHVNWPDMSTVNISKTSDPGGPGSVLLLGSGQVNQMLGALQTEGLITVQRRMPPFQVYKQWKAPEVFLERLYA